MRKSSFLPLGKDQAAEAGETGKSVKRLPVRIPTNRFLFASGSKTKGSATQGGTVRREPVRIENTPQGQRFVRRNIIKGICPKPPGELASSVAKKFAKQDAPIQQSLGSAKTPGLTAPVAQRPSMRTQAGAADTVAIVSAAAQTEVAAFPSWAPWARIEAPRTPILLPSKKPSAETIRAADAFIARSQRALDLDMEKSAPTSATSVVEDVPVVSTSKFTTGQKSQHHSTQITKINPRNTISATGRGNATVAMTNVPFLIKKSVSETITIQAQAESDTTASNYPVPNEQVVEPQRSRFLSRKELQSMSNLSAAAIEPSKSSPMLESMRKSLANVVESPRRPSLRETEKPSVDKDPRIMSGIVMFPSSLATKQNTNQPIAGPSFKSPPTNLTPQKKMPVLKIFKPKTCAHGNGSTQARGPEIATDTAAQETVGVTSQQVERELQAPSPAPEADLTEMCHLLANFRAVELEQAERIARIEHLSSRLKHKVSFNTKGNQLRARTLGPMLTGQSPFELPLDAQGPELSGGTVEMVQTKTPTQKCYSRLTQLPLASTLTKPDLPCVLMEVEQPEILPAKNSGLVLPKPALFIFQENTNSQCAGSELDVSKVPLEEPKVFSTMKPEVANQEEMEVGTPPQQLEVLPAERHSSRLEDRRHKKGSKTPLWLIGRDKTGPGRSVITRAVTKQMDDLAEYLQLKSTALISKSPLRAKSVTPVDSGRQSRTKSLTPVVPRRGRPRLSPSPVVSGRKARVRAKSAAQVKTPTPVVSTRKRPRHSRSPKPLISGRSRRSKTQTPDVSGRDKPRRSQSPTPLVSRRGRSRCSLSPTPLVSGRPRRFKTRTPDVSGRERPSHSQSPTPILSGTGRPRRSKTQTPDVSGRRWLARSQSPTPILSGTGRPRRSKTQTPDFSGRRRLARSQSPTPILSGTGRPRRSKTQTPDVSGRRRLAHTQSPTPVLSGTGRPRRSKTQTPDVSGRERPRRSQSPTPVSSARGRPSKAKPTTLEVSGSPSFSKAITVVDLKSNKRSASNVGDSSAKRARTTNEGPQLEVSSSAVFQGPLEARKPFAESWASDSPLATSLDATVMDETTASASCVATIATIATFEMFQKEYMAKQGGDGNEAEISAQKEQFHPHVVAPVSPSECPASNNKTYLLAAAEHSYCLPPWAAHSVVADYHCESLSQVPHISNTKASRTPSFVSTMGREDANPTKKNETSSNISLASPEKMESAGQVSLESATRTGSSNPSISESPGTTASNQLGLGSQTSLSPKSLQIPVVSLERLSAFSLSPDFSQSYYEYINPDVQPKCPNRAELDLLMNSPLYAVLSRPLVATVTPSQRTTAKSIRTPSSPTPMTTRRAWRPSDLIKGKSADKITAARKSIVKNPFKSKYNSPARTPKSFLPAKVASAKKLDDTEKEAKKPVGRKSLVQYQKLRKSFPKLMMTPVNTPVSRSRINVNALNSAAKTSRNVQTMLEMLEDT